MSSFGKRLRECREAKNLSQQDLSKLLGTSYTVIGKYERDEMKPSIDVAKRLAKLLDTTVGYLLGESKDMNVLRDPAMLKRLNEIQSFPEKEREHILCTLDALIKNVKLKTIQNEKARTSRVLISFVLQVEIKCYTYRQKAKDSNNNQGISNQLYPKYSYAKPSIDVATKIADVLEVSLDYLVGSSDAVLEKSLVKKISDIQKLPQEQQNIVTALLDAFLRDHQAKKTYAH